MTQNQKSLLSDLGLLYASAIWGTTFFIVKKVVEEVNPFTLCAHRFLLAAVILFILLLILKKPIFSNLKEGIMLGFFVFLIYITQTIGLIYTTAVNAAFITGLFVAFVPLFMFLIFKTVPGINRLISVFIALLGLWFLTGGLSNINKGDIITLFTAVAYALHILFADKYVKRNIDPYTLCFQQFLFVSLLSYLFGFLFKAPLSMGSFSTTLLILFLVIFPTVTAFLIQLISQKIASPIRVALVFALEPVFGAVFAWTLGGERFILAGAFGGFLIFIAIFVSEMRFTYKEKSPSSTLIETAEC